jgi:hypothetical protein
VIKGARYPKKRLYVPTLMVQEPIFLRPVDVIPIVQGNVVATLTIDYPTTMAATPIVGIPMAEIDEEEEPIF